MPPPNKYPPADDVKLGQEAAAQARKELPLLQERMSQSGASLLHQKKPLVHEIPAARATLLGTEARERCGPRKALL